MLGANPPPRPPLRGGGGGGRCVALFYETGITTSEVHWRSHPAQPSALILSRQMPLLRHWVGLFGVQPDLLKHRTRFQTWHTKPPDQEVSPELIDSRQNPVGCAGLMPPQMDLQA